MRVNEIFTSIQGEGPWIGRRVTFVRLYGCNKSCEWCDTKYAQDSYMEISPEEVAKSILRTGIDAVVFTGGEPALQIEEVGKVVELLSIHAPMLETAIETNGSIIFEEYLFDVVVVSPKSLDDAEWWKNTDVYLKFVVYEENVDEIMSWCVANSIPRPYFMPLGATIDDIMRNSYLIMHKMEEYKINGIITPRLHIIFRVK